jgi:hypothetical protein
MGMEIDQHRAALDASRSHRFDTKCLGLYALEASPRLGVAAFGGADHVLAAAPAVVEDRFGHAIAVGVEERADMGKGIPLG